MVTLHRPTHIDETCALLRDLNDPIVYGGGTAIQILRKQGIVFAEDLVDLGSVEGLSNIAPVSEGLEIGAMATARDVEKNEQVRTRCPLAAVAYGHVANPRVRNTATVGGNLAHGDYRLDPPTALLVLDASVQIRSARGARDVRVREFFTGFQQTALEEDEVITSLTVPSQPAGSATGFIKQSSLSANDWPAATAAVLVLRRGAVTEVRLGLGALADTPVYGALESSSASDERTAAAAVEYADTLIEPIPDIRGSSGFKRALGLTAVEDAVLQACKELPHD